MISRERVPAIQTFIKPYIAKNWFQRDAAQGPIWDELTALLLWHL